MPSLYYSINAFLSNNILVLSFHIKTFCFNLCLYYMCSLTFIKHLTHTLSNLNCFSGLLFYLLLASIPGFGELEIFDFSNYPQSNEISIHDKSPQRCENFFFHLYQSTSLSMSELVCLFVCLFPNSSETAS